MLQAIDLRQGGQPNDHPPAGGVTSTNKDAQPDVFYHVLERGCAIECPLPPSLNIRKVLEFSCDGALYDLFDTAFLIGLIPNSHECIFKGPFAVFVYPS